MLNDIYYHGSKHLDLQYLDIAFASERNPFGPAIYLTKDEAVADCYSRNSGAIYRVRINGDNDCVINLDEKVRSQPKKAIAAIQQLSKRQDKKIDILDQNARDVIHPDYERRAMANVFLKDQGIWMLYGHLGGMELSGLMDRGVQYAVINNAHISIVSILYPSKLYGEH